MDEIKLRPINIFDLFIFYKWRNENLKYFVNNKPVNFLNHVKWFFNQLKKLNSHMFIVLYKFTPVGMIGLDVEDRLGYIQRVLLGNKKFIRMGIMSRALNILLEKFDLPLYKLEVLRDNKEAILFYIKNGFVIDKKYKDKKIYRMVKYGKTHKSSPTILWRQRNRSSQ